MAPFQVEQRLLLDGAIHAHALHQAVRGVRVPAGAVTGFGATNEHAHMVPKESLFIRYK